MPGLAVNVDHIATIREARKTVEPDPVAAAFDVERAGADGIVVHLRQDRRHIQERDVRAIREMIRLPLNLEMAGTPEMIEIAAAVRPDTITLVPENPEEVTTEGGLNLRTHGDVIHRAVLRLRQSVPEVSLFIDPDPEIIRMAADIQAHAVELHTGKYADAPDETTRRVEFQQLHDSVQLAHSLGLSVRAGHGLTYLNTRPVAKIPFISELSIGHSIVSRAVFRGMFLAVQDMLRLVRLQDD